MTTTLHDTPHGMTANAVASVSLDPPLVLVCVERRTVMAERVVDAGVFALSFLDEHQAALSLIFADADRPQGHPQFAEVAYRGQATGSPVLDGNVGWVDCRVWSVADGGDHLVVIGEVVALGRDADRPLVYYRGEYGRFVPADLDHGGP